MIELILIEEPVMIRVENCYFQNLIFIFGIFAFSAVLVFWLTSHQKSVLMTDLIIIIILKKCK